MSPETGPVLDRIVARVRERLAEEQARVPEAALRERIAPDRGTASLAASLSGGGVRVIAEVKYRSPSAGSFGQAAPPERIAAAYAAAGAAAVSVVTEPDFFGGALEFLDRVRGAAPVPVLRKDFILEPYQLLQAAAHGADAVLLIAAVLSETDLAALLDLAEALDLECLVEVHTETDLEKALAAGALLVGVNNRNLADFSVDVETTRRLTPPALAGGALVVSESGLGDRATLEALSALGVSGFLIGTHFMGQPDPGAALAALLAGGIP